MAGRQVPLPPIPSRPLMGTLHRGAGVVWQQVLAEPVSTIPKKEPAARGRPESMFEENVS